LQFEGRKKDHIKLSLDERNEAVGLSGFDSFQLIHEALPEFNFSDITLETQSLGSQLRTPFLVSSMTAGHGESLGLNQRLAEACESRGWRMGVGSQRRELNDSKARNEWIEVRKKAPNVEMFANLGLSQIVNLPVNKVSELVEALQAKALIVHLNALQEVVQPEGTPHFQGGLKAIANLSDKLSCPVVVKETGCGLSEGTMLRLADAGVRAIDVSGFGGTHWGRIEGGRNLEGSRNQKLAATFSHWGISTVQSLRNAQSLRGSCEVWGSGGVRNGLHAAKAIALGASIVGFAKPILQAALEGDAELENFMALVETELKTALFCTGCQAPKDLRNNKEVIAWQNQ
jgi:isopentenyl-diphosphate delta-isomerase